MSFRTIFLALLAMLLMLGFGCSGQAEGDTCTWEGSGFTASHNCRLGLFCLRSIDCPGGKQVDFGRCVGTKCSTSSPCPTNQLCVKYSDNASYCIDAKLCP